MTEPVGSVWAAHCGEQNAVEHEARTHTPNRTVV